MEDRDLFIINAWHKLRPLNVINYSRRWIYVCGLSLSARACQKENTYIKLPNITEIMALELFSVSKYSILKLESSEK